MRIAAAMIGLAIALVPRPAAAGDVLLLDVRINDFPVGKIGEFVMQDGALLARGSELRDLGLRSDVTPSDELVALSAIPGITWRFDGPGQQLFVTAASAALVPTLLKVDGSIMANDEVVSGTGVTIDYDLSFSSGNSETSASGLFDVRAFSPLGTVSSGFLAFAGNGPSGHGSISLIRLDTTFTHSDIEHQRRTRIGDFVTGGLRWTRPLRMAGIQVVTDFGLRPDLITFPLPSVSGTVALPSAVDVLVNGTRLFNRPVPAGPFEIPQLPVVTGAGRISVAVSDALGRQVVTERRFYASAELLSPGLQSYSAQAGVVRRNWGILSNDYGSFAASATLRRGLSSSLTVEAAAEATHGAVVVGGGAVINAGNIALIDIALAGSHGNGHGNGMLISLGIQRSGPYLSFGASTTLASRRFRDIAAVNGDPVPHRQVNASVSMTVRHFGSVGLAFAGLDRRAITSSVVSPAGDGPYLVPAQHARIVTASYSGQFGRMAVYATGYRDFARLGGKGMLIGLTLPLGTRRSASLSGGAGTGGRYAQVQMSQSIAKIGDWGYQLLGSKGASSHAFGEIGHKTGWALLSVGADHSGRETTVRGQAQGSLSMVDGGLFASNQIDDSFAIIDTNGLAGVRVLQENRSVGRTNAKGLLLVAGLRSFELNRLSVDPSDIPMDATLDITKVTVRPADRSGVVVRFPVTMNSGALLRLVDETGVALPAGYSAKLIATGVTVPVGFGGQAYVQMLVRHNVVLVERLDGRHCRAEFDYQAVPGEIPVIGPVICRRRKP